MYPRTMPGRVMAFFLCIWGVFITSLTVVTLTSYVTLTQAENKALKLFDKLEDKDMMKVHAGKVVYYFCKLVLQMKKGNDPVAERKAKATLRLLMKSLASFRHCKSVSHTASESLLNQSDLVSMVDTLHKSIEMIKSNQQKILETNDRCTERINKYILRG